MNRSCFALSMLLTSLALLAIGSFSSVADEIECGFYPAWPKNATEETPESARTIDALLTGYDEAYDRAVYRAQPPALASAAESEDSYGCELLGSSYCRENWTDRSCGHDWLVEEYQPYDYLEDHHSAAGDVDLSGLVQITQSAIQSAKEIEVSPGAWVSYVSRRIADTIADSQLIRSAGSAAQPEVAASQSLVASPTEEPPGWDEWDCWYDTGDWYDAGDWDAPSPVALPAEPAAEVASVPGPLGRKLVLLVARALDTTGRSLRSASEYLADAAGIETAELSWRQEQQQR